MMSPKQMSENRGSSPYNATFRPEQVLGMKEMVVPIFAGILSALRRVIARRVSLKVLTRLYMAVVFLNQLKSLLPAISSLFSLSCGHVGHDCRINQGRVAIFCMGFFKYLPLRCYLDIRYRQNIAEESLHMVFSSPRHLMVAGGCIIAMEIMYKMDFSLLGFVICSTILGVGIYETTSLEHSRKDSLQNSDLSNGIFEDQLQIIRCLHFPLQHY